MPKCQASNVPIQCLIKGHLQVQMEITQTPNPAFGAFQMLISLCIFSSISSPNLLETQMRLSSPVEDRNPRHDPSLGSPFLLCSNAPPHRKAPSPVGQDLRQPRHVAATGGRSLLPFYSVVRTLRKSNEKTAIFFQLTPSPSSSFISALPPESFPDPTEGWIP